MRTRKDIEIWLRKNINKVVKPSKFRDNDWVKIQKEIEDDLGPLDEFYGKCCHVAHFMLFLYGGKAAGNKLWISKPKKFYKEYKTTHWWVELREGGRVDLTASQFDKFNIEMDEFYNTKMSQDIGFPFNYLGGEKGRRWEHYDENVPSRKVLELGRRFQEEFGKDDASGFNWWLYEFDRLEGREQNELDKIEIELRKTRRAIKNKIKIRKQYKSTVRIPELTKELKEQEKLNDRHYKLRREESRKRKQEWEKTRN